ncbi:Uncharacterised protein [Enterobacter cancerogenus]|uniref:Uncharacterized protein n=1 Tax=Enterobacter cancerogenus TaxID=69218 RepID=A0A484WXT4_9ENTR|nr:Uncharacterised protein [Enterobacter cancerogenus]
MIRWSPWREMLKSSSVCTLPPDLPFEMLDWVIVNASRAAGYDSPKLDSRVLEALAACVDLQKGYGITPNTFVSFIGPVNPYGREKVNSLYAELFIYPDQTGHIPFNANIKINDSVGLYESTCHKALGVTSDEFTRIGGYCFGKNADTFRMTEYSAGQILSIWCHTTHAGSDLC